MAQAFDTLESLKAIHSAVGDLTALLDVLRRDDHLILGMERAQNAAILLARLAANGTALTDPDQAAACLGPVLCITARERRVLLERLQRMHPDQPRAERVVPLLPGEVASAELRRRRRRDWRLVIASIGGLSALVAVLAILDRTALPSNPGTTSDLGGGPAMILYTGIGVAVAALAIVVLTRLLTRPLRTTLPALVDPPPIGQGLPWFDEGILQGALRLMGARGRVAGRWLDLPDTLRETIRRAGWPVLVRGGRLRTPEHVLLAQLTSADDPQMLVAAALIDRLRATDLRVTAYTFFGTPNWLYPWTGGEPIAIPVVIARQEGSRLLLLSDGSPFYDPFADTAPLPPGFESFTVRVLLTPLPRADWGWREHALDHGGWRLAEQSTEGLAEVARWLAGPREVHPLPSPLQPPVPQLPTLLQREDRFFADEPPSEAMRMTLRDELVQWLDPDPSLPAYTYDLLCCLAIGVHLSPGTVERVIAHLRALGAPLSDEAGLRRLLRLPWFTRGYLPGWLREDLLRDLSPPLADIARRAWLLHLADLNPGHGTLSPQQEQRLTGEVQLRLAQADPITDARMRGALGIEAPTAARPVAPVPSYPTASPRLATTAPRAALRTRHGQEAWQQLTRRAAALVTAALSPLRRAAAAGISAVLKGLLFVVAGVIAVLALAATWIARRVDRVRAGRRMPAAGISAIPDGYLNRIAKTVPMDLLCAWVILVAGVKSSAPTSTTALWVLFAIGIVITPVWVLRRTTAPWLSPAYTQAALSTVAFGVWVFALGEPFSSLPFYRPEYGSVALGLFIVLSGTVVPKTDTPVALWKESPRALKPIPDDYFRRWAQFFPLETIAAWTALAGVLRGFNNWSVTGWWILFGWCVMLSALLVLMRARQNQEPVPIVHAAGSTVGFVVWVFATGEPFSFLSFYSPIIGSVALAVFSLVSGLIDPRPNADPTVTVTVTTSQPGEIIMFSRGHFFSTAVVFGISNYSRQVQPGTYCFYKQSEKPHSSMPLWDIVRDTTIRL